MRVAHLLPAPVVGGAEIGTKRLVSGLSERGIDNLVFCPPDANDLASHFRGSAEGIEAWQQPEPWLSELAPFLTEALRMARVLRARDVDLVHCAKVGSAISVGSLVGTLAGSPVVTTVCLTFRSLAPRYRPLAKLVDRFVFVSEATRRESSFGISMPGSQVIHRGLAPSEIESAKRAPLDLHAELGIPPSTPIIAMVSRISPQKDFSTLADAIVQVADRTGEPHLVLVGDGPENYVQRIKELFTRRAAANFVTFTGFREDALKVMNASDVVVLVSHSEGVPQVLIEAMGLGQPIVATDVGGISEAVEHEVNGHLVEEGEAGELADAIAQVIDDPAYRHQLGRSARDVFEVNFSMERYVDETMDLYEGLLR